MLKDTILDEAQPVEVAPATEPGTEVRRVDFGEIGTLHELLALALDDFEKVLRDPRYAVQMGDYHMPDEQGRKCHVCLAGAVMAKSLGASPAERVSPHNFPEEVGERLDALDDLRMGEVLGAAELVGICTDDRTAEFVALSDKWSDQLANVCDATDHRDGWRLLRKLRRMQGELAAASI